MARRSWKHRYRSMSPKISLPDDDLENGVNGISEKDLLPERLIDPEVDVFDEMPEDVFEFTCKKREQRDGLWHYFVKPIGEYDDLDFKGHDVLINGALRPCKDFYIHEDNGIVIVTESG